MHIFTIYFIFINSRHAYSLIQMLTLKYPKRQSISQSNILFQLYDMASKCTDDKIKFDLSMMESLTPFGITLLASTIYSCHRNNKKCFLVNPVKRSMGKFLRDTGFYKFVGLDPSNSTSEVMATKTVQVKRAKGIDYQLANQIILVFDSNLNLSPGVKGSLLLSMNETMTNVIDHSGLRDYFVCVFTYPKDKKIKFCITDLGKGILTALRESEEYQGLDNDYEAIQLATEEGVTSRLDRRGYGLSHIKKFISANKGKMYIISGKGKVSWQYDQRRILEQSMATPFKGTIIKLIINIDKEGFYILPSERNELFNEV